MPKLTDHDPEPLSDIEDIVLIGHDDTLGFNEGNILPQEPETLARIRQWLQPTDYDCEDSEYRKHLSAHTPGTGTWLLSSSTYRHWHDGQDHGTLWIKGIPGSGKSVVASTLIDQLKQEGVPMLYFFFRQIIDANHQGVSALRDWLAQILTSSPPLQAKLLDYLQNNTSVDGLLAADLWRHLRLAASHLSKVYIIVDALDEMDQEDAGSFFSSLFELTQWRPARLKLIITSRPIPSIERSLRPYKLSQIRLEEHVVDFDIARYVENRLVSAAVDKRQHFLIKEAVPGRAKGIFLYAKLAMNAFLEPNADIPTILERLPLSLDDLYRDLIRQHARRSGVPDDVQALILQCVTHSNRQLRLLELADMIYVTHPLENYDLKATKDLVRKACGPLLQVLSNETICVVHHSLTEFLTGASGAHGYPVFELGSSHKALALICLRYLLSGCLDELAPVSNYYGPLQVLPAFTKYAGSNWHVHVRKASLAGLDLSEVNEVLEKLLRGDNLQKVALLADVGPRGNTTPVILAATLGLTDYTRVLLQDPANHVFETTDSRALATERASEHGFDAIVKLLLLQNPSLDAVGKALYHSASNNHIHVITSIIEASDYGVNGRAEKLESLVLTALRIMCQKGNVEAVDAVLPWLNTPGAVSEALHHGVEQAQAVIVEHILRHPHANVNATSGGRTALYTACANHDANTITLLLAAGADPNIPNDKWNCSDQYARGYTALHALASRRSGNGPAWGNNVNDSEDSDADPADIAESFRLLVEAGADVYQRDPGGNTALHKARDPVVARLLLLASVDVNAVCHSGYTAVFLCRSIVVLRVLIQDGDAIASERGAQDVFKGPLLSFLRDGKMKDALSLLELGADATAVDEDGNGLLHHVAACQSCYEDDRRAFVDYAISCGTNVNLKNRTGQTALHKLVSKWDAFQSLLKHGADIEAVDNDGRTPIFYANKVETCQKLVKAGSRTDLRDRKGRTLLFHWAIREGLSQEAVEFFTSRGLDPKQTDYQGNTIWHALVRILVRQRFDTKRLLLKLLWVLKDLGVGSQQANNQGRTPLHVASSTLAQPIGRSDLPVQDVFTVFDYLLELQQDVDYADHAGVTALHLACTFSEYQTQKLLEKGANPLKRTKQGLTALHLAARSRQANIVGLLINVLKKQCSPEELSTCLDRALRPFTRTALSYACASGRPETVKVLLEAGARSFANMNTLDSCCDFESELHLWHQSRDQKWKRTSDVGGVAVADKTRPQVSDEDISSSVRLDEIIQLLTAYGAVNGDMKRAITTAAESRHDYTVECLVRLWKARRPEDDVDFGLAVTTSLLRRKAVVHAFETRIREDSEGKVWSESDFHYLMAERQYDLVEKMLLEANCLEPDMDGNTYLHHLVAGGYAAVLAKVLKPKHLQALDDPEWCEQAEAQTGVRIYNGHAIRSLLLTGCRRVLPNMDVLCVLVENTSADLNVRERKPHSYSGVMRDEVGGKSALHVLVDGGHWWQTAQAMPYLVKQGINIDIKDEVGQTVLNAALNRLGWPDFNIHAVRMLVELGADVNATDTKGNTCLSKAGNDIEMIKLLTSAGATVTPAALYTAMDNNNAEVLSALLSSGADANMRGRFHACETSSRPPGLWTKVDGGGVYPLDYAVTIAHLGRDYDNTLVRVLLDHGADPYAKYEETTVMHRSITKPSYVKRFINRAPTSLEVRDSKGMTLLLMACAHSTSERHQPFREEGSIVQNLLNRGANIRATDNMGRNALHRLSTLHRGDDMDLGAMEQIAREAPQLLNARDKEGNTPLHCSLGLHDYRSHTPEVIDLLLAAGAQLLPTSHGDTPIHLLVCGTWRITADPANFAEDEVRPQLLRRFVDLGVDINAKNFDGETALFSYTRRGSAKFKFPHGKGRDVRFAEGVVVDFLSGMGADFEAVNGKGETVLHVLARNKTRGERSRMGLFKTLMEKGLDTLAEDEAQKTVLDVAAAVGAEEILKLFEQSIPGKVGTCS